MATDTTKLQGEIIENPENQEFDVEALLVGLLRSLIDEQKLTYSSPPAAGVAENSLENQA